MNVAGKTCTAGLRVGPEIGLLSIIDQIEDFGPANTYLDEVYKHATRNVSWIPGWSMVDSGSLIIPN